MDYHDDHSLMHRQVAALEYLAFEAGAIRVALDRLARHLKVAEDVTAEAAELAAKLKQSRVKLEAAIDAAEGN